VHVGSHSRVTPAFRQVAGAELLSALDAERDVVYALDADLTLQFLNLAWWNHAREHGGERCIASYALGASVRPVIPDVLRRFYEEAFASVLASGAPLDHEYRCATPTEQQLFRMRVARLGADGAVDTAGESPAFLVISNQLVHKEAAHEDEAVRLRSLRAYVGSDGILVQCSHCRRCRRLATSDGEREREWEWDWVPAYVASPPALVSHGLCTTCFAHHYPPG
jgi:hypothetical protein